MKIWMAYRPMDSTGDSASFLLIAFLILVLPFGTSHAVEQLNSFQPPPPPKTPGGTIPPVPDSFTIRQGGDTFDEAFNIITLPFSSQGTTSGYTDNYDETCPYSGSISPDVVYSYTPEFDIGIEIDLCGSAYDTKVYVYDSGLNVVACNDDFYFDDDCGIYVSRVEYVELQGGTPYYFVIDGYGGEFGEYLFVVTEGELIEPCILVCPDGGMEEGEPPLEDEYNDSYNCGCGCYPPVFQDIPGDGQGEQVFCGVSGWFLNGYPTWDADNFHFVVPSGGTVTLVIESEAPTYLMQTDPMCGLGVIQMVTCDPCEPETMIFENSGDVSYIAWIVVRPATYEAPPPNEYSYLIWLSGLEEGSVASEAKAWGSLKATWR